MLWFGLVLFLPRLRKKRGLYSVVLMFAIGGMGIGLAACIPEETPDGQETSTETPIPNPTTPSPADTTVPEPTAPSENTPIPPTATPNPNYSSTGLHFPLTEVSEDGELPGFSACAYDSTLSMDANVADGGAGATVYAAHPAAEVVIVDTTLDQGTLGSESVLNDGWGNLVVIGIRTENLSLNLKDSLNTLSGNNNEGWLYISYAHLATVTASVGSVPQDLEIGTVGNTGRPNFPGGEMSHHLDLMAFVIKDNLNSDDPRGPFDNPMERPFRLRGDTSESLKTLQSNEVIGTSYSARVPILPSDLWPEFNRSGICSEESTVGEYC